MRQEAVPCHLNEPVLAYAGAQGASGVCGAAQSLPASMNCLQGPVLGYVVAQSLPGTFSAAERLPGPNGRLKVARHLRMS